MKYVVISCVEREIELEAVCDTYDAACAKMKECFLEHHRYYGYTEKELEELKLEIEAEANLETSYYGFHIEIETEANLKTSDYGFHSADCGFAWSNVDDNYNYDIKIFAID